MANDPIRLTFDVETTNKREFLQVAGGGKIPRITQAALFRADTNTMLVGGGLDAGWTNLLDDLILKHGVTNPEKIPPGFWAELAEYGPSVRLDNTLLNKQVKDHVRMSIHARTLGIQLPSGADLMQDVAQHLRATVAEARRSGRTVQMAAYSKDFDIGQMFLEMGRGNTQAALDFRNELRGYQREGLFKFVSAEGNVHRAMFEQMMKDPGAVPVYSRGRAFDYAAANGIRPSAAGLADYGAKDWAKRAFMDDLRTLSRGGQLPSDMPASVRAAISGIPDANADKQWGNLRTFQEGIENESLLQGEFRQYYTKRAVQRAGPGALSHAYTPWSMEYMAGWNQDSIAGKLVEILERRGEPVPDVLRSITHRAPGDVMAENVIMDITARPEIRAELGEAVFTESYQKAQIRRNLTGFLEEHAAKGLSRSAAIAGPSATSAAPLLSRLRPFLPHAAIAGGLLVAGMAMRRYLAGKNNEEVGSLVNNGIEGLRNADTKWDLAQGGISPSRLPGANTSSFGSGRHDTYYHPQVFQAMQWWENPQNRARVDRNQAKAQNPRGWGRLSDAEVKAGRVNLTDYIYTIEDADTIALHKAWLRQDIPVLGKALGSAQRALIIAAKTLTGVESGIEIRMSGLDAPEMPHQEDPDIISGQPMAEWATEKWRALMENATSVQLQPGQTYGRYLGTLMAGGRDLNRELVRAGGAIALSMSGSSSRYKAEEQIAYQSRAGIWQDPYYEGVMSMKRRGKQPIMNQMVRRSRLATSTDAAQALSASLLYSEWKGSGIRDTETQNRNVFPSSYRPSSRPSNLGSLMGAR